MRVTIRVTVVPSSPVNVNCPRGSVRDTAELPSARTRASLMGWPVSESLMTPLTEPVCAAATAGGATAANASSTRDDGITRGIGGAPKQVGNTVYSLVYSLYYPRPGDPQEHVSLGRRS